MTANRKVEKAYLFFKSKNASSSIKDQVKRIRNMHPLVDLYLPGKTSLIKGDNDLLKLCMKLGSRGFNQTLKIIVKDKSNFDAMVQMLIIIDSMIRLKIVNEGEFAFLAYRSRAKKKMKYRKLRVPIPSQRQSA
jgi:hypothetical protein